MNRAYVGGSDHFFPCFDLYPIVYLFTDYQDQRVIKAQNSRICSKIHNMKCLKSFYCTDFSYKQIKRIEKQISVDKVDNSNRIGPKLNNLVYNFRSMEVCHNFLEFVY